MNKKDLISAIVKKVGGKYTKSEIELISEKAFDTVKDFVLNEGIAKIFGLGIFKVKQREARKVINPRTKEVSQIGPRKVITFKPSSSFSDQLLNKSTKVEVPASKPKKKK